MTFVGAFCGSLWVRSRTSSLEMVCCRVKATCYDSLSEPPVELSMFDSQATEQQAKPKGTHERQGGKAVLIGEMKILQFYVPSVVFW